MDALTAATIAAALTLTLIEDRLIRHTGQPNRGPHTPTNLRQWRRARLVAIIALTLWSLATASSFTHDDFLTGTVAAATTLTGIALYSLRGYVHL